MLAWKMTSAHRSPCLAQFRLEGDMASYATQKVRQLCKLFVGCRGAVTRIHTDNHRAHAWLTNLHGYKLYVLCAPEECERVLPPGEGGEGYLPRLDPLDLEQRALPQHSGVKLHATILRPGETIVVPEGWWHYAASLTPTITLMCNFWDAANVRAVEDLFLETVARTLDHKRRQNAADVVDGRDVIPSATAAASSSMQMLAEECAFRVVHKPFVYIREPPCTNAPMLGIPRPGAIIRADAERDGWLRLAKTWKGGKRGWVLRHGWSLGLGPLLESCAE
jgi:chloride channel 7